LGSVFLVQSTSQVTSISAETFPYTLGKFELICRLMKERGFRLRDG
jgi:hypothetical protein